MNNLMPCSQTRCGFLNNGCKSCDSCKAKPNIVNECCERCFNCEFKDGSLRWGEEKQEEKNTEVIKIKQVMPITPNAL